MTKRSAITLAAGLALALLVGVAAISLTMDANSAANAGGHRKPKIEHRTQTVRIHKKASSPTAPTTRIVQLPSSGATASSSPSSGYSESESERSDDDQGLRAPSSGAEVGDD